MTAPKARQAGQDAGAAAPSALDLVNAGADARPKAASGDPGTARHGVLLVLRNRADFLRAARAARAPTPAFLLQARCRAPDEGPSGARVGFTCTRKIGNAVTRNRAKRRLRALARAVLPEAGCAGWDYVLVGRPGATVSADFAAMLADLRKALARVHRAAPAEKAPVA